jgi:DNA polymerase-3 subunit gamma/tau
MSYQVIARKYRPQRFEDVVGQEHVTTTLMNAIRAGRIAHGYIFCGPRGTGKTTLARIFAKALNCTGGPKADFSLDDPRVREITEGRSLDVLEIDGASNNGVEQVRELRDTARFAPASGTYKIYIIDEVHMLSTAAFNALLKTLEEPPAHVKFLFATTDPEKVLVTILSRCQRFDLRRIPAALISNHLAWIASQEGVTLDDAALFAIARGAEGGMRDAESTLDQLISFCGNRIEEADVLSMFGLAARRQLLDLTGAILGSQPDVALRLLDELARSGKDLGRLLNDVANHFRNLLVYHISKGDRSLLEATESEFEVLASQTRAIEVESLTRVLESLSQAESHLRDAPSKRIFLEVALLKAIEARNAVSLDVVLRQLQALRAAAPASAPIAATGPVSVPTAAPTPAASSNSRETEVPPSVAAPGPAPSPARPTPPVQEPSVAPVLPAAAPVSAAASASPAPPEGVSTGPITKLVPAEKPVPAPVQPAPEATPEMVWSALQQQITSEPIFLAQLGHGRPLTWIGGVLSVEFPLAEYELLNATSQLNKLRAYLQQAGYVRGEIRLVEGAAPPPVEVPKPAPIQRTAPKPPEAKPVKAQPVRLNKEEFLNDPAIRAAIEVFRAQLIEVRAPGETPATA